MYETNFLFNFGIIFFSGILIGLYFNFLKGQSFKHSSSNILLGILGACLGVIVAAMLPIPPQYRPHVMVAFSILGSIYFMIGYWMISKGSTPIMRHLDAYRSANKNLVHVRKIKIHKKSSANLPAA